MRISLESDHRERDAITGVVKTGHPLGTSIPMHTFVDIAKALNRSTIHFVDEQRALNS